MSIIIKLTDDKTKRDYYLEWGTIVDAPITYGLSLKEFKKYYKDEYGRKGMRDLPQILKRVEETGCSDRISADTLKYLLKHNRAGTKEKCIDKEEILKRYCRKRTG